MKLSHFSWQGTLHTLGPETPVITIQSSDSGNIADVKEYLHSSLPSLDNTDLDLLTEKCEGNFQYATQAVDMLQNDPSHANELLNSIPSGLFGLYDFKIKQMMSTIHPLRHQTTWDIIHLITASGSLPHGMIGEILGLDNAEIKIILRPLTQYFDLDELNSPDQTCSWFHSSFREFIIATKRIDEHHFRDLADYLLRHLTLNINSDNILINGGFAYLGLFEKLRPESTQTMDYIASDGASTLLKNSLTSSIQYNRSFFRYILNQHINGGYRIALRVKDPHYILLLGLMNVATKLYLRSGPHNEHDKLLATLHFIHSDIEQRVAYPRPSSADKPKELMIRAVVDYLKQDISKQKLEAMLGTAMLCLEDCCSSPENTLSTCRQYADLCFPTEGTSIPLPDQQSACHTSPTNNLTPIILNGSADFMSPSKAQQISKKGSRDHRIVFSEINNSIWFDETRIRPSETRMKFFKYLASQSPGSTLSYADFAVNVWAHPTLEENQILDRSTRETVKRYIKRCCTISGKFSSLGDCLHFEDGVGFTLTDSATTLCIHKSSTI